MTAPPTITDCTIYVTADFASHPVRIAARGDGRHTVSIGDQDGTTHLVLRLAPGSLAALRAAAAPHLGGETPPSPGDVS